ncbi:MAG: rod shape-determining protein MreD [Chloroflexi bacterium]|nr:rod shape-determining protein MreD [Chloroflexota bacterium]
MSTLSLLAALCLAALVQSFGGVLSLAGGRPDLVLLVAICWSMLRGTEEGSLAGVAGGVLLDLFSGMPFGINAVLLGLVGLIAGLGEGSLSRGTLPLLASTAVLATVAFHGATYLVLQALGWSLPGAAAFAGLVAPSALLNAVLMPLAFRLTRQLIRVSSGWRQLEL